MADTPDSERLSDALGRAFDVFKRLLSALFSVGIVLAFVLIALAIGVYFFDPLFFEAAADSPQNAIADQPRVFESTTTAAGCAPNATGNASIEGYRLLGAKHLVISGNVSLPDASYALAEPSITKRSNGTFVFAVESQPTDATNRSCGGVARYTAKVQLPYGANDYELAIEHDGEQMKLVREHV